MSPVSHPFRCARWGQWIAVLVAGAILMQGAPMQVLVQATGQAVGEKMCRHHEHQDVCPRNPGGPCTCSHDHDAQSSSSESEAPDGPIFEACDGVGATVLGSNLSPLGWTPVAAWAPAPSLSTGTYVHLPQSLSPRRVGNEVFRPPRPTPDVRRS